jgi:hypothetical protein
LESLEHLRLPEKPRQDRTETALLDVGALRMAIDSVEDINARQRREFDDILRFIEATEPFPLPPLTQVRQQLI